MRRPRASGYLVRSVFWLGFICRFAFPVSQWRRETASPLQRWARAGIAPASRFSRLSGRRTTMIYPISGQRGNPRRDTD
jgi:hypothetical protein